MTTFVLNAFDKKLALLAFVLGLAAIVIVWITQIWGGLVPCELCLGERVPYYWGLPLLAVILIFWNRLPLTVWYIAMAVVTLIFLWSVYLGAFHAGVEWKFWPGPSACTALSGKLDLSQLSNINAVRVIPCDVVQWRDPVLRLSLAGYNALVSLVVALLLLGAIFNQAQRQRA